MSEKPRVGTLPAFVTYEEVASLRLDISEIKADVKVLAAASVSMGDLEARVRALEINWAAHGGSKETRGKVIEYVIAFLLAVVGSGVWWQNLGP